MEGISTITSRELELSQASGCIGAAWDGAKVIATTMKRISVIVSGEMESVSGCVGMAQVNPMYPDALA